MKCPGIMPQALPRSRMVARSNPFCRNTARAHLTMRPRRSRMRLQSVLNVRTSLPGNSMRPYPSLCQAQYCPRNGHIDQTLNRIPSPHCPVKSQIPRLRPTVSESCQMPVIPGDDPRSGSLSGLCPEKGQSRLPVVVYSDGKTTSTCPTALWTCVGVSA